MESVSSSPSYFEEKGISGEWDELEMYMSRFNKVYYFEIVWEFFLSFGSKGILKGEEQLSKYGDTKSAMNMMYTKLKKLIDENLLFDEKLSFAIVKYSRL
ncbi:hypothetical protein YC2023_107518 [Brassica napus]